MTTWTWNSKCDCGHPRQAHAYESKPAMKKALKKAGRPGDTLDTPCLLGFSYTRWRKINDVKIDYEYMPFMPTRGNSACKCNEFKAS